ncbi:hypothetical protein U0070_022349 [Myodes glareolus]|uniref:Uncharacterized protein n=1 Tax=Myodes glareolus TaxID=447135 RepID=A0AAW0HZH6_MYOGA
MVFHHSYRNPKVLSIQVSNVKIASHSSASFSLPVTDMRIMD